MDLLQGGSLKQFIDKKENISEDEVALIMKQILEAVHYMHTNNFMHKDLKPENIMFKFKNNISSISIADFGLATKINSFQEINHGDQTGTYLYMAPEQIEFRPVTKVNLYS